MLSQQYLKECFDYDPETGLLTWKKRPLSHFKNKTVHRNINNKMAGKNAGRNNSTRYFEVQLNKKKHKAHRIVMLLIYGWESNLQIDHINHNRADNRLNNLRYVTRTENMRNRIISSNNKTGIHGVHFDKSSNSFISRIGINNNRIRLGCYKSFFDACCARKSAEYVLGFHKNHGIK